MQSCIHVILKERDSFLTLYSKPILVVGPWPNPTHDIPFYEEICPGNSLPAKIITSPGWDFPQLVFKLMTSGPPDTQGEILSATQYY